MDSSGWSDGTTQHAQSLSRLSGLTHVIIPNIRLLKRTKNVVPTARQPAMLYTVFLSIRFLASPARRQIVSMVIMSSSDNRLPPASGVG